MRRREAVKIVLQARAVEAVRQVCRRPCAAHREPEAVGKQARDERREQTRHRRPLPFPPAANEAGDPDRCSDDHGAGRQVAPETELPREVPQRAGAVGGDALVPRDVMRMNQESEREKPGGEKAEADAMIPQDASGADDEVFGVVPKLFEGVAHDWRL